MNRFTKTTVKTAVIPEMVLYIATRGTVSVAIHFLIQTSLAAVNGNFCDHNQCRNGGECVSNGNVSGCLCARAYFGEFCQCSSVMDCIDQKKCGEQSESLCQRVSCHLFHCVCPVGSFFNGIECEEIKLCNLLNPCDHGNQICKSDGNTFQCLCKPGWIPDPKLPESCIDEPNCDPGVTPRPTTKQVSSAPIEVTDTEHPEGTTTLMTDLESPETSAETGNTDEVSSPAWTTVTGPPDWTTFAAAGDATSEGVVEALAPRRDNRDLEELPADGATELLFLTIRKDGGGGHGDMRTSWDVTEESPPASRHHCDPSTSVCLETDGGFVCACLGDRFPTDIEDPKQCSAIDLCATMKDGCQHLCSENRCGCHEGFLAANGTSAKPGSCVPESPCDLDCGSHGQCARVGDVPSCVCDRFFSGKRCEELTTSCADMVCPNNSVCLQMKNSGHITCQCRRGYTPVLYPDGRPILTSSGFPPCVDIDECKNQSACEPHEMCINLEGSFQCNCPCGFKRNASGFCVEFDVCLEVEERCIQKNAYCRTKCNLTSTSYECYCRLGSTLINGRCIRDVNRTLIFALTVTSHAVAGNPADVSRHVDSTLEKIIAVYDPDVRIESVQGSPQGDQASLRFYIFSTQFKLSSILQTIVLSACISHPLVQGDRCYLYDYDQPEQRFHELSDVHVRDVDACQEFPEETRCIRKVHDCVSDKQHSGLYRCKCSEHLYEVESTIGPPHCADIDECRLDPSWCKDTNATCINRFGELPLCQCVKGYFKDEGDGKCRLYCDLSQTPPCLNGGKCVDGNFTCTCGKKWSGRFCEEANPLIALRGEAVDLRIATGCLGAAFVLCIVGILCLINRSKKSANYKDGMQAATYVC